MTGRGIGRKQRVQRHCKVQRDKLEVKKPKDSGPSKPASRKRKKSNSPFIFDIQSIVERRKSESEYWKKSAELDKKMKELNAKIKKEINEMKNNNVNNSLVSSELGYIVFEPSRYNTFNTFKNSSDSEITNFSQRFLIMSVEKDEIKANIIFIHLMKANWSPVLYDVKHILRNWGAELDTLIDNPSVMCEIDHKPTIGRHNFELVMNFLSHSILEADNGFSDSDLLTLAKFTVTISFDHYCGNNINVLKKLFGVCIKTAFNNGDETAILAFAQELYSQHDEDYLMNMVFNFFLPLDGNIMKQIYTYITFKLFKSFLGKSSNTNAFPSDITDWFVQDLVDRNYFKQNSIRIIGHVIRLLHHVIIVFDLYKYEQKVSDMYDFLYPLAKSAGIGQPFRFLNIIDQWRLHLFRLKVERHITLV